mmetsp:Transcript_52494/g.162915  ORF Transcript_52494/g.162915 Transcript_52494/m.162915 type:complete len:619 (+) Transcript_52494:87-1943(+)
MERPSASGTLADKCMPGAPARPACGVANVVAGPEVLRAVGVWAQRRGALRTLFGAGFCFARLLPSPRPFARWRRRGPRRRCIRTPRVRDAQRCTEGLIPSAPESAGKLGPAESAELIFVLFAKGSSCRDAWPKTHKAQRNLHGNRRDALARSVAAALAREPGRAGYRASAAVIVFEDGRRLPSKEWWVLGPAFLPRRGLPLTEFSILRRMRSVADGEDLEGVSLFEQDGSPSGLRKTAVAFLQKLGDPQASILVVLDEMHQALPVAGRFASRVVPAASPEPARRAVFLLGCPHSLGPRQEATFVRAAEHVGWQVVRVSLGWLGEFTSKVVARLQVWHSCGQLMPALAGLGALTRGSAVWQHEASASPDSALGMVNVGWPCPPRNWEPGGFLVHFVTSVHAPVSALANSPEEETADALSTAARCCIASLWRAHHAYRRCRLSLVFTCGTVVTLARQFVGRLRGKAATERIVLRALQGAVEAASTEGGSGKDMPGRRAACVQRPRSGCRPDLHYRTERSLELRLHPSQQALQDPPAVSPADELVKLLDSGNLETVLVHLVGARGSIEPRLPWSFSCRVVEASLQGTSTENPFEVICMLQSGLLGTTESRRRLLEQILAPP